MSLNQLQGNFCGLTEACAEWLSLLSDGDLPDHLKKALQNRFDKAMTVAHFLSLLTCNDDEKIRLVTSNMKSQIKDWLSTCNNDLDLMAAFTAYEVCMDFKLDLNNAMLWVMFIA